MVFSLEALTLIFICYANSFVFFLLVHDVSVTEKQLICVQSRVLNLYGVYFSELFASSSFYIHIFSECVLMFRNSSVIFEEYGGSSLFFAICPFQCIGLVCARTVLGLSVPRNMGPSVPRNMGPSVPRNMGPSVPKSMGPSVPRSMGPSVPKSMGPSVPRSMGPFVSSFRGIAS